MRSARRPTEFLRRSPQGSDPLARDDLRLDRLLRAGQRILDLRVLPAGAVRHGRRVDHAGQRSRDDGALCHRGDLGLGRAADHAEDRPSRHQHRRASASCWFRCWSPPGRSIPATRYVLPFAAAAMLWGHYWDASNCMTIPTVVAQARISRHGERLRLHVRQAAVVPGDLPVPGAVRRDRAGRTRRCSSRSSR